MYLITNLFCDLLGVFTHDLSKVLEGEILRKNKHGATTVNVYVIRSVNNEMKSGELLSNDVVVILTFYVVEGIPSTAYISSSTKLHWIATVDKKFYHLFILEFYFNSENL